MQLHMPISRNSDTSLYWEVEIWEKFCRLTTADCQKSSSLMPKRRKDDLKRVQRGVSFHKENRNEESKHMAADADNFCNMGFGARKRRSSVSTLRTARLASAGISLKTWCDVTCPSFRIATPSCWTSHNSSPPWFCAH